MSRTGQRKTSAVFEGKAFGTRVARNMGSISKKLFNRMAKEEYKGKYPGIFYRAARAGYALEMTAIAERKESQSLFAKLTKEATNA
jgi:hypothetical protein